MCWWGCPVSPASLVCPPGPQPPPQSTAAPSLPTLRSGCPTHTPTHPAAKCLCFVCRFIFTQYLGIVFPHLVAQVKIGEVVAGQLGAEEGDMQGGGRLCHDVPAQHSTAQNSEAQRS